MVVALFLLEHGYNISLFHQQALDHSSKSSGPRMPCAQAPQISDSLCHIQARRGVRLVATLNAILYAHNSSSIFKHLVSYSLVCQHFSKSYVEKVSSFFTD